MPDAPKTGFWHSLPGLMTATAGFLSAVTGAMMGLNQAGVVDLKKIVGAAPSAQTTPADPAAGNLPSSSAGSPEKNTINKSVQSRPEVGKMATDVARPTESSPAPAPKSAETRSNETSTAQKIADAGKPQEPAAHPEQKPTPINVRPVPSDTKPASAAPQPSAPKVIEPKSQPVVQNPAPSIPTTSAPAKSAPQPVNAVTERPVETKQPEIRPPPPPVQDRVVPKTDERLADARRVRPEEVPVVGKGKAMSPGTLPAPPGVLDLTGLKMSIPSGWVKEEIKPEPMGPEAELRIPSPDGRGEGGVVRISHFMGTRGKEFEEKTIERWLGHVSKANGSPMLRSDAKVSSVQGGPVKITAVELSGAVKIGPRDIGRPDHRFLGAIIEYPKGAHLVQVSGPASSMTQWMPAIDAFLKSAKPE
ncbi:MAG: hypothetical protein HY287_04130 [Planctomycetes bacterium]|nr:hypothetical protein [Planctomycetota bacterium]MBI3833502.1 hypothetical protein [Planctomycetota bacterium]